jgi:putative hydrolase of HD superfamily
MTQFADFLNEVGMLNQTPRSGFAFLGAGEQSVAEHMYRMLAIAFLLARRSEPKVDELHLLHLVMFHDLPEARTGDQNYVNHKYVRADLDKLLDETAHTWPYGEEIVGYIREFEAAETPAAQLAKDADQLELLLVLKQLADLGHPHTEEWIAPLLARLKTPAGKELAQEILTTRWDGWWYGNPKNWNNWVEKTR